MSVSDSDITSMLNEELLQRRTTVMFMRNAGGTWREIAETVGVSEPTCRKDYAVVCRDINSEQPANVIARHRAVIFDIQRANYPLMLKGDKDAANNILRALDREAKLLGLDAPTRVLATVSDVEFANESARLIDRIMALDPTTIKELQRGRRQPETIDAEVTEADGQRAPGAQGAARAVGGGPDDGPTDQPVARPEPAAGPGARPRSGAGLFGSRQRADTDTAARPADSGQHHRASQDEHGLAEPMAGSHRTLDDPIRPGGGDADDADDDWSNIE